MDSLGKDLPHELLVAVLNRLSSRPLAVAACVSHSWRTAAVVVNAVPRFFSALSFRPQLEDAMEAVLGDVLNSPFWPDFAMVFAGPKFNLSQVSALVKRRLPEKMPLIACNSAGIAGRDVVTSENVEMIFDAERREHRLQHGLVLVVGRFPGVHVKALKLNNAFSVREVENFVHEACTGPCDGHAPAPPFAILLLGDPKSQTSIFLEALGRAYGGKTAIVGGLATFVEDMEAGCLLAHSTVSTQCGDDNGYEKGGKIKRSQRLAEKEVVNCSQQDIQNDFVSLVFSYRDGSSSNDRSMERVQCQVAAAGGLKAVGGVYKVVSVRDTRDTLTGGVSTQISCERDKVQMDGFTILDDIDIELHGTGIPPNHIGIFRKKKEKRPNQVPHFSLHEVHQTIEDYLVISGGGVKTRDSFRFYQLDPAAARESLLEVLSTAARRVTGPVGTDVNHGSVVAHLPSTRKKVIGGLLFGCAGCGHQFAGESNVASSSFQWRLPGISLGGMFCLSEFGPPALLPGSDEQDEVPTGKAIENFFSSMFVLFYTQVDTDLTGD